MSKVDLILLGPERKTNNWSLGETHQTEADTQAVSSALNKQLQKSPANAVLFWDSTLEDPNPEVIQKTLERPGDVWHAGLKLGMVGLPKLLDYIAPIWMLNCDPSPEIEATSWRISMLACLVRTEVIRKFGFFQPEFQTLDAAALEWGHRCLMYGVFPRHIPWLIPTRTKLNDFPILPFEDELRFIEYRYGSSWSLYTTIRAILNRSITPTRALQAWHSLKSTIQPTPLQSYRNKSNNKQLNMHWSTITPTVSVLIPTLERYPYLRTLLNQLRNQTIPPFEIIVVDQTPIKRRPHNFYDKFSDLPIRVIWLEQPGQCSSRNEGINASKGNYLLFLDDDEEIPLDLIEAHLQNLNEYQAQVSSGVAYEIGAGPLPKAFKRTRVSDVFPTGNTLINRSVLLQSGLFDLAFEHGQRADGDLGIRIYLSGALMVLNPRIHILHHHAPSGGLRAHKARVITYASSRTRLIHRHLPTVTEIYLAMRYFTPLQVRQMLWLRFLGTFIVRGSSIRKLTKLIISAFLSPQTWYVIRQNNRQARRMLEHYPQYPDLPE